MATYAKSERYIWTAKEVEKLMEAFTTIQTTGEIMKDAHLAASKRIDDLQTRIDRLERIVAMQNNG